MNAEFDEMRRMEQERASSSLQPDCSAAVSELNRRIEYCAPVFLALHAEIKAGHYSNALEHVEPLLRELKLCEHDCRYLVEMRKQQNAALFDPAHGDAGKPKTL